MWDDNIKTDLVAIEFEGIYCIELVSSRMK
jgi:hypothetical protein